MPNWTKEQLDAINKSGTNIIVSAGAGSGKTAVLTERVISKLQNGIKINELLILTFTNAAASEMKERIRKKINEHKELKDNLDYLESAYITTFDSYTLSLVKKYNYLLNVSNNLKIIDDGVINIIKTDIIDQIFDNLYKENNPLFKKLINDFTIKNDTNIKSAILTIIKSLELKSNFDNYLDTYLENYLSESKINEYIEEYIKLIKDLILEIENNLLYMESSDYFDYYVELSKALEKLINSKDYDEIVSNINVSLPKRPRGSDEIKEYKDNIDKLIKNIKSYLRFKNTLEIKDSLISTKDYLKIIIEIIKRYKYQLDLYKNKNDLYEFNDIAIMAIRLLKENIYIRDELKDFYKEIFVDEYQDTNDLQEEFINLINNNNVYMVGDIKQSIYGFRNANPIIFKDKYTKYSNIDGGIKIDLLKNFRSRNEVLNAINLIFSHIMDDQIGGANYTDSHQMIFGNNMYDKKEKDQNYDLEIYNYSLDEKKYKEEEIEAFIIGKDIIKKVNDGYKVIDNITKELRPVKYEDFCIIMDRGTTFPTVKKIFEYLHIPLTIYEDKKLTNEIDIILINNLLGLILKIKDKLYDVEFKYYFMSIARSFLFEFTDEEIFKIIQNNSYEEAIIYKKCLDIINYLDTYNNYELVESILDNFNFYEKLIINGDIEEAIIRINNLLEIAENLSEMGYTHYEFKDYITKMIEGKNEIKYSFGSTKSNSVKIMNIHKSKGLEFPICYFCGFKKSFNISDIKERFIFDNHYGIITPFYKDGVGATILKDLLKQKYMISNISEKIRLLYVALTRVKEKMIIVVPLNEEKPYIKNLVDLNIRKKYNSFLNIIDSISGNLKDYIVNINIEDLGLTKDYIYQNKIETLANSNADVIINYENINIENEIVEKKKASKTLNGIVSNYEKEILELGTTIHKCFEETDFFNIEEDNPYKEKIKNLIKVLNIKDNTQIYKEHEFIYEENSITYHGVIDLILIEDNNIKIIDYKLKNIDDEKYLEQLSIYYRYIKSIFDKDIKLYLYSIMDDNLREIIIENN